jgi:ribosome-associated toxin RatA of RatAB toxin-antitoxin module
MNQPSVLFIPDISGFTHFVQTTEVEHSQHVISELLEILINANTQNLILAEIEGDALFFYKEEIPSMEKLLAQVETMFTAFYSHLKLMETNRICPCNACSSAVNLQLKIVIHAGDLKFLEVQGKRKPFGKEVIEVHRLMKNSIDSDEYVLMSQKIMDYIKLPMSYTSQLFQFQHNSDSYDGELIDYGFSVLNKTALKLKPFQYSKQVEIDHPDVVIKKRFQVSARELLEYITNYKYRKNWVKGYQEFKYNENEITRNGTEHTCVINGKHFNFIAVTKNSKPEELSYGELTQDLPFADNFYQFYVITPLSDNTCSLSMELYWKSKSVFKRLAVSLVLKHIFKKVANSSLERLERFVMED